MKKNILYLLRLTLIIATFTLTAFCNPTVSGVTKLGKQTVSIAVGPRIPVAGTDVIKPSWGWRAELTFVFPT